jgi:hypothetical protein
VQEKGNTNAKFWSVSLLGALGGERHWHQVGLRQLSGLLILVFARNNLKVCVSRGRGRFSQLGITWHNSASLYLLSLGRVK